METKRAYDGTLMRRVHDYVVAHPDEVLTTEIVASEVGGNHGSVYAALERMTAAQALRKRGRGWYFWTTNGAPPEVAWRKRALAAEAKLDEIRKALS